jgi:hypothetical protein
LGAVERAVKLAPQDGPIRVLLASAAARSNRPRIAVEALSSVEPRGRFGRHAAGVVRFSKLTAALHMLGEHGRELQEVRRGLALFPDRPELRTAELRALVALGRWQEVERLVAACESLPEGRISAGEVMVEAATELRAHGHPQESMALARRAAEWACRRIG